MIAALQPTLENCQVVNNISATTTTSGLLTAGNRKQTGSRNEKCAADTWQLTALPGQRIELIVRDYTPPNGATAATVAAAAAAAAADDDDDDDDVNDGKWRKFHETCPAVAHIAEVTSPGQPDDHVLTIRACDSPISRRHVYTSRGHRVIVALMTSSPRRNPLHLFVQFQGGTQTIAYYCC